MADTKQQPLKKKVATWQLFAVLVLVFGLIAFGWNLRATTQADHGAEGAPQAIFFFSPTEVLGFYIEDAAGEVSPARQMEVMDQANRTAREMAQQSGAIVLHANAAVHVPDAVNVSPMVYDRLVGAELAVPPKPSEG